LKDTVNEIGYYLNDTDFDFDKVNRSRFWQRIVNNVKVNYDNSFKCKYTKS
jgi:hypothetical protein